MKHILLLFILTLSGNVYSQSINPTGSIVEFEISNFGFNTVSGTFEDFQGTIDFDTENLELCNFDVCISTNTVNTSNAKRDAHLLEADYFNAEEYPTICFSSQTVSKSNQKFVATGELTMKGKSKLITIPFEFDGLSFMGSFKIDRTDFNIGPGGGFSIGKNVKVKIRCNVN